MLYARLVPPTPMTARFPAGAWFSVVGNIRLGAGGQTQMVLLRHRLLLAAGLDVPLLTYNPVPSYDTIRATLLADGLLLPESRLVNLHEDLRERELTGDEPSTPIDSATVVDDIDHGTVWRSRHLDSSGDEVAWEYLRPDGTAYAVTPAEGTSGPTRVTDRSGRLVMTGDGLGDLWRWWTRQVVPGDGPVFLVSDSRFVAEELGLLDDERIVLMHQMHNPHLRGSRRWDSPIEPSYADSLNHVDRLDALNVLTERQRRDLVLRFGEIDQLHVVPNPVEAIAVPSPAPSRVPGRIVVIARLHPQKQLDRAVEAFALVAAENTEARLEIYGDGDEESALRSLAADLGVADRIDFHGHVVNAADTLWTADLAWLTSRFEGYGLFILEARVRECPVLSFDVPYGPAEQIDDGVDGRLVPPGDAPALARATLDLLADRDRLEAMRAPARAGALAHGHDSFVRAWAEVGDAAWTRRSTRTRIDDVTWRVDRAHTTATVSVEGDGDLRDLVVRWEGWDDGDDAPTDLTRETTTDGPSLTVRRTDSPRRRHERLLVVWRNSTWQTPVPPAPPALWRRVARRLR